MNSLFDDEQKEDSELERGLHEEVGQKRNNVIAGHEKVPQEVSQLDPDFIFIQKMTDMSYLKVPRKSSFYLSQDEWNAVCPDKAKLDPFIMKKDEDYYCYGC